MRRAGAGVADDVGERLLHDAEGGQVDAGGARGRASPVTSSVARRARPRARASTSASRSRRPGGRAPGRGPVVAAPQHVEHRAQLAERLLAGVLDGGERRAGLLGLLVQQVQGDAGLHVDERDVVGEHVVQLAGDAQPLLAGPAARLLGLAWAGSAARSRRLRMSSVPAPSTSSQCSSPTGLAQVPRLLTEQWREQRRTPRYPTASVPHARPAPGSTALTKAKIRRRETGGPWG